MKDTIYRQDAIDALCKRCNLVSECAEPCTEKCNNIKILEMMPSAQPEVDLRKIGEWDMFELITSAWYGKQYYFKQSNDIVYSRLYHKYMTVDEAIREFLGEITDG